MESTLGTRCWRFVFYSIASLTLALFCSELFLSCVVPEALAFGSWFSNGVQKPDKEFGAVFSPNFSGTMAHKDGVFEVPLRLSDEGFRLPLTNAPSLSAADIVFVGGHSMMFGYGLRDEQTIPGKVAKLLKHQVQVHNTALPGFDVVKNYKYFEQKLKQKLQPQVLVLSLYGKEHKFERWDKMILNNYQVPSVENYEELFRFMDGRVTSPPPDALVAWSVGKWYYQSIIIHKLARLMDSYSLSFGKSPLLANISQVPSRSALTVSPVEDPVRGLEKFSWFIQTLTDQLKTTNTQLLLVLLPVGVSLHEDIYAHLREKIVPGVRYVDIHQGLRERLTGHGAYWIADGHYSSYTSELIAKSISGEMDQVLSERRAAQNGSQE